MIINEEKETINEMIKESKLQERQAALIFFHNRNYFLLSLIIMSFYFFIGVHSNSFHFIISIFLIIVTFISFIAFKKSMNKLNEARKNLLFWQIPNSDYEKRFKESLKKHNKL